MNIVPVEGLALLGGRVPTGTLMTKFESYIPDQGNEWLIKFNGLSHS